MSTLYVVATPIGNREDLSERALRVLRSVAVVLCEDTRVTRPLLQSLGIETPLQALHQHSTAKRHEAYIELLRSGKDVAIVSDAGTPGISDPGGRFVEDVVTGLGDDVTIVPIPGPSAVVSALSVSGFPADTFTFLGFPPHKKGRKTFFESTAQIPHTVVFYESIHRIEKALESLAEVAPNRPMLLARELTKLHETLYRGMPSDVLAQLQSGTVKGECVIVLAPHHL